MKNRSIKKTLAIGASVLFSLTSSQMTASEPEWGPSRVKDCNRECLVQEGDDGKIAAFADDCVRHENGYQTVNNPAPGGRMMPAPPLPNPNTPQGREQLKFSMLTCAQQIDTKIFAYMKHIRPRRVLVLDEQKGLAAAFALFVHDGTRRGAAPDAPPGMLMNAVIMETFGVRGGKIHEIEAMPFVTIPYGLGDGWTEGSGR
ncbi:MAG: hypothetical protein JOZ32_15105 [Bryobacterales bacterium]|nr:hypothetical protein [Bryobacterales bacterium]